MHTIASSPCGLCGRGATLNLGNTDQGFQELYCVKGRGGRPGLPVPNSLYGLCGRKATLNLGLIRTQEMCEGRGGRP